MAITRVKTFTNTVLHGTSFSYTFSAGATNTSDAIVVLVSITDAVVPSSVQITATGWTWTQLGTIITSAGNNSYTACFVAIAPNTTIVTHTVAWVGGSGGSTSFQGAIGDEFTGNDTTGGSTTFDAFNSASSGASGNPTVIVIPANNNDALWGGTYDSVTAVGANFNVGVNDANGDWTEFQILTGGRGTPQTVNFAGSAGGYTIFGVSIKPSGEAPGASQVPQISLLGAWRS
jgi:hypothetical protein